MWEHLNKTCVCFCLQGYGPKCSKVLGSGVTAAEKAEIVRAHNEYRATLANGRERRGKPGPQPPAADMQQMVSALKKFIIPGYTYTQYDEHGTTTVGQHQHSGMF